jgi:uncharacterized repeat protein (TIGR01451 family)
MQSRSGAAKLTYEIAELKPREARQATIPLVTARGGAFPVGLQVVSAQGASAEASTRTVVQSPALVLECAAPTRVLMGRPAELCLTLQNAGDALEERATVRLPIPAGASVTNATAGGRIGANDVTWELAGLAPQASQRLCATIVHSQPGLMTFSPRAAGECAPSVTTSCATTVAGVAGVLLEVVDREDPIPVGDQVTYDLRVTNQGDAPITNIKFVCALPDTEQFVSGEGETPVTLEGQTLRMGTVPVLPGKAVVAWKVVVKALKAGDTRFTGQITADQFPQPIERTESTTLY